MALTITQVDAFTATPFKGNPAAVCILEAAADDAWMQAVATEMNLSETAFLTPGSEGFDLRWFTPSYEVDLCGHATLASAHVLWESGRLDPDQAARFHTRSGLLTVRRSGDRMVMDFPATPPTEVDPPPGLLERLPFEVSYFGRSPFDCLLVVASEQAVRNLTAGTFAALDEVDIRGFIVTARATSPRYDFVSRFFAPGAGVSEDPVTGSAHCCLGPYWQGELGKDTMLAYQASPRGGEVGVRLSGDRVLLEGQAVTVMRGELLW
jgi:predicted PhzF superfamily epimerase YddE/YHI9